MDEPYPRIVAVSRSRSRGVQKENLPQAHLIAGYGLEGDAHAGDWPRQISLLGQESIARLRQQGLDVGPGDFAENLTTAGLELTSLPLGTRLRIGSQVELEVTQIGKEDHPDSPIRKMVGASLIPDEGIFARVIVGGEVHPGDSIEVVDVSGRNPDR
ncbi:MAG: MOSC domain-containing protein [Deltaproteobacteria bacterium]|nr:MOSC domain-containing protein [Deltaproteobacteria bacterium]MBW1953475.1 MOSC domain-containing protein [Deltaproteobacteria bacterium]MBW1986046.1 MOSC domain-containing protein [Deltaproteobacteria bacterium]MBW2133949.1 MOSC domain-containing protein [Deltaproteobacteria bacterium]